MTRPVPLQACVGGSLTGEGSSATAANEACEADGDQICDWFCSLYCEQQPFDVIVGCQNGHDHPESPGEFHAWGSCGCHNWY